MPVWRHDLDIPSLAQLGYSCLFRVVPVWRHDSDYGPKDADAPAVPREGQGGTWACMPMRWCPLVPIKAAKAWQRQGLSVLKLTELEDAVKLAVCS